MTSLACKRCGHRTPQGNCPIALEDGHVVQCVGEWAEDEKHAYLRTYIEATREARRKFSRSGFLDLFAGPGSVRVRETGAVCDGSPLIALKHRAVPFTRVVLCDLARVNVEALRYRTAQYGDRAVVVHGDANERIHDLVDLLPEGLNLAVVDPFGIEPLHFDTLRVLGQIERMDLFVNFPTSDLRRNRGIYCDSNNEVIARALGMPDWRTRIGPGDIAIEAADLFVEALTTLGYTGTRNRMLRVPDSGSELYRIIFASRSSVADTIWKNITRHAPTGQRGFDF
jgi:three-Cys-motif partner protein